MAASPLLKVDACAQQLDFFYTQRLLNGTTQLFSLFTMNDLNCCHSPLFFDAGVWKFEAFLLNVLKRSNSTILNRRCRWTIGIIAKLDIEVWTSSSCRRKVWRMLQISVLAVAVDADARTIHYTDVFQPMSNLKVTSVDVWQRSRNVPTTR